MINKFEIFPQDVYGQAVEIPKGFKFLRFSSQINAGEYALFVSQRCEVADNKIVYHPFEFRPMRWGHDQNMTIPRVIVAKVD